MSQLFKDHENSDSDIEIKTNSEYAKNYNTWRQKEEFHKLTMKYKDDTEESSSSSDDDNDEGIAFTEKFEQDFFKTLSYLKNKDPRIYNKNFGFFEKTQEINENTTTSKTKKNKDTPIFIKDYERQLLLEKDGQLSDDENIQNETPTYSEEQNLLKESLKDALKKVEDEDESGDENWGGIFKTRQKTSEETTKEEEDYKLWLGGQKEHLDRQNDESELKPLKDYWTNPKLDSKEKFLRDYILNNRFMESENSDYIPTYDEIVHDSDDLSEDEKVLDTQEEFEHKYNFRYEDPDQDFIKRYPRIMEHTLRQKDDKRKVKRAERKTRKDLEKQSKMEELKQLKVLKRQEIEEKIKKLQEVTGNNELGFDVKDIDEDFDPEEHDKRMQELFNSEFYSGPEGDIKPEFPELDEELEIEKWDDWRGNEDVTDKNDKQEPEVHCEDEGFNMDCDYDPKSHSQELINNTKKKKKNRRKSKFAKLVSEPKPVFNPKYKTYQEYLDEYYKIDCEDVIGDIPCRFKYRKVVSNDFGLSVEEILMAKDKELNRWSSLKKAVQYRPDHVEKYDVMAFRKKAQNEHLKRKFIPSLFASTDEEEEPRPTTSESGTNKNVFNQENPQNLKIEASSSSKSGEKNVEYSKGVEDIEFENKGKKKRKHKSIHAENDCEREEISNSYGNDENNVKLGNETIHIKKEKNKKRKADTLIVTAEKEGKRSKSINMHYVNQTKKKEKKKILKVDVGLTDARLEAYGINPKKYKNKLKYGGKS
ncbi:hypothetical protein RN001_001011 [Aquatica leii]|uniref:Protein KRI1 homolog n=1 Tax=Aquatica leii TaxID=1421715 RepID=A0AAN7PAX4_9COLE|nr:hypothetical protein RN001_001011 [Aquatica leii]